MLICKCDQCKPKPIDTSKYRCQSGSGEAMRVISNDDFLGVEFFEDEDEKVGSVQLRDRDEADAFIAEVLKGRDGMKKLPTLRDVLLGRRFKFAPDTQATGDRLVRILGGYVNATTGGVMLTTEEHGLMDRKVTLCE